MPQKGLNVHSITMSDFCGMAGMNAVIRDEFLKQERNLLSYLILFDQ